MIQARWSGSRACCSPATSASGSPLRRLTSREPSSRLTPSMAGHALGVTLYGLGLAGTLIAQGEDGPVVARQRGQIGEYRSRDYRTVSTGTKPDLLGDEVPGFLGLTLLTPNVVALAGSMALVAAVELQVRFVEEPHLLGTHNQYYAAHASRVGRFAPGVGKLKPLPLRHRRLSWRWSMWLRYVRRSHINP